MYSCTYQYISIVAYHRQVEIKIFDVFQLILVSSSSYAYNKIKRRKIMIQNEILLQKKEQMEEMHMRVCQLLAQVTISDMLRREYKRTINQYESMYLSIEAMKKETSLPEAVDGLIEQQIQILQKRTTYELDFIKQVYKP